MPSTCISSGQFLGANCKTGTGYLVFLTNGITDASGNPAVPDTDYAAIKSALAAGGPTCPSITDATLNGVCQLTGAHLRSLQIAQALRSLNPGQHRAHLQLHDRVDDRHARAAVRHYQGVDAQAERHRPADQRGGSRAARVMRTFTSACSTSRTT